MMTSPGRMPALAAGASTTPTPASRPSVVAMVCAEMPSDARPESVTLPELMIWFGDVGRGIARADAFARHLLVPSKDCPISSGSDPRSRNRACQP